MREFKGVDVVRSFLSQKWIRWWCAAGLALTLAGCSAGGPGKAATQDASDVGVLVAPLKIPIPLDKARHKIDVTFDIPEPPKGERVRGYFLGLRILFAPATGQVPLLENHPVKLRVTLHRLQSGAERPVEFVRLERVGSLHGPGQYVPVPIKDDVAVSRGSHTEYSEAPPGTPDASTRVLEIAAPRDSSAGRYRLRVETLDDLPALAGFKSFLAFEQSPRR